MRSTRVPRFCAAVVAVVSVAACGGGNPLADRAASRSKLIVGISYDQPGLSLKTLDGKFVGFDIDVATYVAKELGIDAGAITWRDTRPAERENVLQDGEADLVVGDYTIDDQHKQAVSFAGPYLVTSEDVLVRLGTNNIVGPESLGGKRLCSVKGTTSVRAPQMPFPPAQTVEYDRFPKCVQALLLGTVDAISSDDIVLAGYAAQNPELLKLVGKPFMSKKYGIGMKKGDPRRGDITNAIKKMINDGSWQRSLRKNVAPSGYKIPQPPTVDG